MAATTEAGMGLLALLIRIGAAGGERTVPAGGKPCTERATEPSRSKKISC